MLFHSRSGKAKQDLASALHKDAFALPGAQQATRREHRNVGLISQLLIPDVKFDASWNLLANSVGQVSQYSSKPLRGGIRDQRDVSGPVKCKIINRN